MTTCFACSVVITEDSNASMCEACTEEFNRVMDEIDSSLPPSLPDLGREWEVMDTSSDSRPYCQTCRGEVDGVTCGGHCTCDF